MICVSNQLPSLLVTKDIYKRYDLKKENYTVSIRSKSFSGREKIETDSEDFPRVNVKLLRRKTHLIMLEQRGIETPRSTAPHSQPSISQVQNQSPSESRSPLFQPEPFEEECLSPELDMREREYFIRSMVIGERGVGKHSLVGLNNAKDTEVSLEKKGDADFVVNQKVKGNTKKKFHFWLKTAQEDSEVKKAIWKSYYRWATAFIFVYSITDKKSFEVLDKAIEDVLKVVPKDKFFGILVGTKLDLNNQRVVNHEEAERVKHKYKLNYFFETSRDKNKESQQLLRRLNSQLKLIFEAI